ncbi:MAG: protein kinase [Chloroflexota bacterium]
MNADNDIYKADTYSGNSSVLPLGTSPTVLPGLFKDGQRFQNRYTIQGLIGEGGMGQVYRAIDLLFDIEVVIKVIHPLHTTDEAIRRFWAEARTLAQIKHNKVVRIYDFKPDTKPAYLVLEYIEGETLYAYTRKNHPLPLTEIADLLDNIAEALDFIHEHGLIHRDVKPGNIMVKPDGDICLLDFGIVKDPGFAQTKMGSTLGTPLYMAPEQFGASEKVTSAADVYALGVILFELLTGEYPFEGTDSQIMYGHCHVDPPVDAPRTNMRGLKAILDKALQKNPAKRYTTAGQLTFDFRETINEINEVVPAQSEAISPVSIPSAQPGLPPARWAAVSDSSLTRQLRARLNWRHGIALAATAISITVLLLFLSFGQSRLTFLGTQLIPTATESFATEVALPPPTNTHMPPTIAPPTATSLVAAIPPTVEDVTTPTALPTEPPKTIQLVRNPTPTPEPVTGETHIEETYIEETPDSPTSVQLQTVVINNKSPLDVSLYPTDKADIIATPDTQGQELLVVDTHHVDGWLQVQLGWRQADGYQLGNGKFGWIRSEGVTLSTLQAEMATVVDASITVAQAGSGYASDYPSIQAAIDDAPVGATIAIRPGFYQEALRITKEVHLIGVGQRDEIIIESVDASAVYFEAQWGSIKNLTLRSTGDSEVMNAVYIASGELVLQGCTITSTSGDVVGIYAGSNPTISHNVIHDGGASGIRIYENGTGRITANAIYGNAGAGVWVEPNGNPIVENNNIWGGQQSGVFVYSGYGTIQGNEIYGNAFAGIQISEGSVSVIRDNVIRNGEGAGILADTNSKGIIAQNKIYANASSGISVSHNGDPCVVGNIVHHNARYGIHVHNEGLGTFISNTMDGNQEGNLNTPAHIYVVQKGEEQSVQLSSDHQCQPELDNFIDQTILIQSDEKQS